MADNKKYYYMRLKENFFDSSEISLLESMPDGYLYSNILLKLYLRSLRGEGRLAINNIPYSPEMIATVTHHPVETVQKALSILAGRGQLLFFMFFLLSFYRSIFTAKHAGIQQL